MKTVRRPPYPKWNPGYFPCSSLTPPSAFLTPSIPVLRWIRAKKRTGILPVTYSSWSGYNRRLARLYPIRVKSTEWMAWALML